MLRLFVVWMWHCVITSLPQLKRDPWAHLDQDRPFSTPQIWERQKLHFVSAICWLPLLIRTGNFNSFWNVIFLFAMFSYIVSISLAVDSFWKAHCLVGIVVILSSHWGFSFTFMSTLPHPQQKYNQSRNVKPLFLLFQIPKVFMFLHVRVFAWLLRINPNLWTLRLKVTYAYIHVIAKFTVRTQSYGFRKAVRSVEVCRTN